jgi:cell wall-associated NlpC family hydrolase
LSCAALAAVSLAAASAPPAQDPAAAVVRAARAELGDTYTWGAAGPKAYDCSGLTSSVWAKTGHVTKIPRTSAQQQAWAVPIPVEQARVGDLAFFGDPVTHVGLISGRTKAGLTMIDASATRKAVVERTVWTSGTVRFGRVPRPGMPAVRPWKHAPVAKPKPKPAPAPLGPLVKPGTPALQGRAPLVGLPAHQHGASSPAMVRFATLAKGQLGVRTWSDTGLVTALWKRAGGRSLPATREAIAHRTTPVALANARIGDLVVYGAPGEHVGVYVGNGWMVDASRSLGAVVRRPVWSAPGVQVRRYWT